MVAGQFQVKSSEGNLKAGQGQVKVKLSKGLVKSNCTTSRSSQVKSRLNSKEKTNGAI